MPRKAGASGSSHKSSVTKAPGLTRTLASFAGLSTRGHRRCATTSMYQHHIVVSWDMFPLCR